MEVGIDIVDLDRIEKVYIRYGVKFLQRFLSEEEIAVCMHKPQVIASVAGRFAAKEAVVKALGTGFSGEVHWKSFEILNDDRGVLLCGRLMLVVSPPDARLKSLLLMTATLQLQQH